MQSKDLMKTAERLIGRFGVKAVNLWLGRPRQALPDGPPRILIILLAAMGDGINLLPMIARLRHLEPLAKIEVLTSPRARAVFEGFPALDRIRSVDIYGAPQKMAARFGRMVREVQAARYDIVIDTEQYSALTGLVALRSGAPRRIGFSTPGKRVDEAFTDVVPYEEGRHESHCFLDLLTPLYGAQPPHERLLPLGVAPAVRERSLRILKGLGCLQGPIIALHPLSGSTATSRRWPAASFIQLGQQLIKHGANVVLVGSPEELRVLEEMALQIGLEAKVAAGRTDLHELAGLLAACDVFVGNDSGPMHLAAAMGTRVIGLFGPNIPAKWGPLGSGNRAITAGLPCSPCIKVSHGQFRECANPVCMTSIPPERVLEAVEEILIAKGVQWT